MMKSYALRKEYYEAIKDRVATANPYFYTDEYGSDTREMVEVDIDEEAYIIVATEFGWM